jgi:pimeloyl-ACP methyl ester carboxylesterase
MGTASTGVILLHGLARTRRSMQPLAAYLRQQGYAVVNVGYPSRRYPVETLAQLCIPPAVAELRRARVDTLGFVTHSMGGILLRSYLAAHPLPELGRVVMLSPPNQGSELVDCFRRFWWFRRFFGPAGCQLGTTATDLPLQLGPLTGTVGILTGNRPFPGVFSRFFPGPHDGKVSVARARLPGMSDFLTLPYGHSFIINHRPVWEQVAAFLEHGRFRR